MLASLAVIKNEAHRSVIQRLFSLGDVNIRASQVSKIFFLHFLNFMTEFNNGYILHIKCRFIIGPI